jgi:ankyrin repeat protein
VRCLSWAHEACLAKSVFETGGCPTCRKSISLIDNEIILGQAAADGDAEKLRRLLENGTQHSPRGLFDSTPLLQAAQNGQRETIRLLREHGASISEQDEYQRTALHFASADGHAEAADELLLHGADISPINASSQRGN